MSDDPVKECEVCGEPVKRLLFPVAIHFKGNGFYSTDYAKKNAKGTAGTSTAAGNSDSESLPTGKEGGKEAGKDSAPEASKAPVTKTAEPVSTAANKD